MVYQYEREGDRDSVEEGTKAVADHTSDDTGGIPKDEIKVGVIHLSDPVKAEEDLRSLPGRLRNYPSNPTSPAVRLQTSWQEACSISMWSKKNLY